MKPGKTSATIFYDKSKIDAVKSVHPQYFDKEAYEQELDSQYKQAQVKRDVDRTRFTTDEEMVKKAYRGSSGIHSVGQYLDYARYSLPGSISIQMREAPSTASCVSAQDSAYVASRNGRIIEYREKVEPREPLHKRFMKWFNRNLNKHKKHKAATVHIVDEGSKEWKAQESPSTSQTTAVSSPPTK